MSRVVLFFQSKAGRIVFAGALTLVVVGCIGTAIYFYRQYRLITTDAAKAQELQNEAMLSVIAKVIELPNEKPSVVTITDRDKLQDQEFFRKAENGDKIIIYEGVKRVYLYRPRTKKVIDVAPLVFNVPQEQAAQQPAIDMTIPTPTPSPLITESPSPSASPSGDIQP